jgi:hypothetical protein
LNGGTTIIYKSFVLLDEYLFVIMALKKSYVILVKNYVIMDFFSWFKEISMGYSSEHSVPHSFYDVFCRCNISTCMFVRFMHLSMATYKNNIFV